MAYDGKAVRTFGDVRTEVILTPRDRTVASIASTVREHGLQQDE